MSGQLLEEMGMPGDERRNEQVRITIEYAGELSEDVSPEAGGARVVIGPEQYAKVKKGHVNLVFYFLAFSSALCLGTVAFVPRPVVQETALCIWAGSVGLARFLLAGTYRRHGRNSKPAE
jgi:hypothetical protein